QALADAGPASGSAPEAESWRRKAAERYDALVARHPEAYADHAARFWLGAGGGPGRARLLAAKNLRGPRTPAADARMGRAARATGRGAGRGPGGLSASPPPQPGRAGGAARGGRVRGPSPRAPAATPGFPPGPPPPPPPRP